jgi:hypothetical protein
MDVVAPPQDEQTLSFRIPRQFVFLFETQGAIGPDHLHLRLDQSVAPLGLVTVFSFLHDGCFVDKAQVGSLHFDLCGNLWCVWGKKQCF